MKCLVKHRWNATKKLTNYMLPQFVDRTTLAFKSPNRFIFSQSRTTWSTMGGFHKASTLSRMSKITSIKKWVITKVVDLIWRDLRKVGSLAWRSNSLVDFGCLATLESTWWSKLARTKEDQRPLIYFVLLSFSPKVERWTCKERIRTKPLLL